MEGRKAVPDARRAYEMLIKLYLRQEGLEGGLKGLALKADEQATNKVVNKVVNKKVG